MDLFELHRNVSAFVSNYDRITDDFIEDHGPDFIDMNTEAMRDGQDSEGNETPEYQNPEYGQLKAAMGGNPKNWDFKFSGSLQSAMKIKNGDIFSTDQKAAKLQKAVPDMFGVQQKRMDQYVKDQLTPDFVELVKRELKI